MGKPWPRTSRKRRNRGVRQGRAAGAGGHGAHGGHGGAEHGGESRVAGAGAATELRMDQQ